MKEGDLRSFIPSPEEFAAAFGVGSDPSSLSPLDACGVILASLKALHDRSLRGRSDLDELRAAIHELKRLAGDPGVRPSPAEGGP